MRYESMPPRITGRGRPRFRWLLAGALAVMGSACGAQDGAQPSSSRPDSKPVNSQAGSDQGAFISAGGRIKSAKYVMDFTMGQSTQNQDQSTSTSYLVRGGLIGGNGRAR
jgi:hypothetical protein